eukprot:2245550-Prymnesium_polylepis.1
MAFGVRPAPGEGRSLRGFRPAGCLLHVIRVAERSNRGALGRRDYSCTCAPSYQLITTVSEAGGPCWCHESFAGL